MRGVELRLPLPSVGAEGGEEGGRGADEREEGQGRGMEGERKKGGGGLLSLFRGRRE